MNSQAAQVFVYYRVHAAHVAAAIAAVRALQAHLQALIPGLSCTLSRRVEVDAERPTLMEVYGHADGVGPDWQRDIERLAGDALAAWIVGERHVEVFLPCA